MYIIFSFFFLTGLRDISKFLYPKLRGIVQLEEKICIRIGELHQTPGICRAGIFFFSLLYVDLIIINFLQNEIIGHLCASHNSKEEEVKLLDKINGLKGNSFNKKVIDRFLNKTLSAVPIDAPSTKSSGGNATKWANFVAISTTAILIWLI